VKTTRTYDSAAVLLTAFGVLFLVGVYLPLLNPDTYEVSFHQQNLPSIGHYIVGTPIAMLILAIGWHFKRRSDRLKKNGK